ncbi:MAG: hypothetical protein RR922_05590 [Clostridia bacterium]
MKKLTVDQRCKAAVGVAIVGMCGIVFSPSVPVTICIATVACGACLYLGRLNAIDKNSEDNEDKK